MGLDLDSGSGQGVVSVGLAQGGSCEPSSTLCPLLPVGSHLSILFALRFLVALASGFSLVTPVSVAASFPLAPSVYWALLG